MMPFLKTVWVEANWWNRLYLCGIWPVLAIVSAIQQSWLSLLLVAIFVWDDLEILWLKSGLREARAERDHWKARAKELSSPALAQPIHINTGGVGAGGGGEGVTFFSIAADGADGTASGGGAGGDVVTFHVENVDQAYEKFEAWKRRRDMGNPPHAA